MSLIGVFALAAFAFACLLLIALLPPEEDDFTRVEMEEYEDWEWPSRKCGPESRERL